MRHDVALRRRNALLDLELLVAERDRRVRQPHVVEAGWLVDQVLGRELGRAVVLGHKRAADMAGADAQLQDRRHVAGLAHRKCVLDQIDHVGQLGPWVQQQQRALGRIGVGALLNHAGAFAVVLADDDQRATDHARRCQVRQRVGRDIGADDRLPGHRTTQRVVDRRAQHRGG